MPAITLFGYKSLAGGDDLQLPSALTIAGRLLQGIPLCGVLLYFMAHETHCGFDLLLGPLRRFSSSSSAAASCRTPSSASSVVHCWLLLLWLGATLLYSLTSIVLELRIWYWSNQGTPVQMEPRSSHVSRLLEWKLWQGTLLLLGIGLCGTATLTTAVAYYKDVDDCQANDQISDDDSSSSSFSSLILWWLAPAGLLLLSQWAETVLQGLFLCRLSQRGYYDYSYYRQNAATRSAAVLEEYDHQRVQDLWAQRCVGCYRCLSVATCYIFGGQHLPTNNNNTNHSFADVAMALADFLESQDVLDFVFSDFMTGLLILQRLQRQRVYAARQRILRASIDDDDDNDESASGRVMVVQKRTCNNNSGGGSILPSGGGGMLRQRLSSGRLADDDVEGGCTTMNRSNSEDLLLQGGGSDDRRNQSLYLLEHPSARLSLSDLPLLDEAARYAKHALAIYTWVLYLYEHPLTGPLRLALHGKCCGDATSSSDHRRDYMDLSSPRRFARGCAGGAGCSSGNTGMQMGRRIDGDNFFQTNKKAILSTADIPEEDLVYVQLQSSFTDNPYCIMLDHGWKTVVLSVRGTFSLEDCVTDTLISPVLLEPLGQECGFDATNQYCHSGVVACARNVYRDLNRHQILDQLLLGTDALYPDYTLRLVGHSLGASTSVLLSYMLRTKFPTLRCIAYSPAGCTFTWEMATRCNEWTTACVLDSDIVPRLSVDAIRNLRDEVLDIVGRIKVPKYEVAQRLVPPQRCLRWLRCAVTGGNATDSAAAQEEMVRHSLSEILYDRDSDPPPPQYQYHQQVARFHQIQSERKSQRFEARLYPPGRILWIAKTGELKSFTADMAKCLTCCTSSFGSSYGPVWVGNDELNEIVVSPTMGTDHFPTRIRAILERVAHECSNSGKHS